MAISETIITGKKYRVWDKSTSKWKRMSYWTKASDVEFNDGSTAEARIADIETNLGSPSTASAVSGANAFAKINTLNSSLEKNGYGAHGIKNLVEQVWYYTQTQQYKTIAEATYYVENGKTYTISFDTPNTGVQCYIQGDSVSGLQTTSAFYLDGTRKTITAICVATGQHTKEPFIAIRSNTGVASGMLSNLQIEEGSTATEYNPFAQSNVALTENYVALTSNVDDLYNNGVKNICPQICVTETRNGVTFTVNSDGTIRVQGTANANIYYDVSPILSTFLVSGESYKLSGSPSNLVRTDTYLYLTGSPEINDNGQGNTFTYDGRANRRAQIVVFNGKTVDYIFKPMITLATTPNSDYAHYVPYAQTNAALTATTILKSVRIYGDGSKTQATLLNELFTALNGLGKNVLVSKVIFRTNDSPSNIQMGSVYDHNLSYFNVFNVTVGANDIVHSNVYLNSSSSRAIQNTNGTSVNYSSQVLTSSQYVELDYYEM